MAIPPFKENKFNHGNTIPIKTIISFFIISYLLIILFSNETSSDSSHAYGNHASCDPEIAPFYIYDLPYRFNGAITSNCRKMHPWNDMCPHVVNRGLGPPLHRPNWYASMQFTVSLIFHARADNHPCRTYDPNLARIFYIPFYLGYYTSSNFLTPNHTIRDIMALDLANHMSQFPTFKRHGGRDHFIVSGRVIWDVMRPKDPKNFYYRGSTRLLSLKEFSNISTLIIERDHVKGNGTQFGIPFPSFFHPKSNAEMTAWQDEVRKSERTHLFSFVGAMRPGNGTMQTLRRELYRQCNSSERCLLIDCNKDPKLCYEPESVIGVMKQANFCLQPPGDSWTRKSVFDSMLAGCIPVFFAEQTAYVQYIWYLPKKREDWSVLISHDKADKVKEILAQMPEKEVEKMREMVIRMIPRVTYAHPNATQTEVGFRDAVDVALIELTKLLDRKSL
ncbi:hypothetical protein LUZ60_013916 [Juncus effusus]|nr:hypothetical protein LUZ60_013916 [Juncus effusus]